MTQFSVTATPRVWRIQGDLYPDRPASVQAFIATDLLDAAGVNKGKGAEMSVSRMIDETEQAKTVAANGKTYTRGEILNAMAAMALAWKAEDDAKA